jgi:ferredoxin
MHKIKLRGRPAFEVEEGTKLVLAIERAGVDISHHCGGLAQCTTCRVLFESPEPPMGELEKARLTEEGVLGQVRLACQIRVDRDMRVDVLMRASQQGWEAGPEVAP